MHPVSATKVTPILMRAVLELNTSSKDYRAILQNRVKDRVWPRCKFPDYNSTSGQLMKEYIRKEINLEPRAFENAWGGTHGLASQVNKILRTQRAYTIQQIKEKFFGKPPVQHCFVIY